MYTPIDETIQSLTNETGASWNDCVNALIKTNGNFQAAADFIEQGGREELQVPGLVNRNMLIDNIHSLIDNAPSSITNEWKEITIEKVITNLQEYQKFYDLSFESEQLDLLYNYQERYLMLIREYKEEIKFLNNTQEDLRKERAKFFSITLEEVSLSLKNSSIEEKTSQVWIKQLVDSFSQSIDISQNIVENEVQKSFEEINEKTLKIINDTKSKNNFK